MSAKQQYNLAIAVAFLIAGCFLLFIGSNIAGSVMLILAILVAMLGVETNAKPKSTP